MESIFRKAKFIRQKCYLERIITSLNIKELKEKSKSRKPIRRFKLEDKKFFYCNTKITCAGMPKSCYKYVEWEKFKTGFTCRW